MATQPVPHATSQQQQWLLAAVDGGTCQRQQRLEREPARNDAHRFYSGGGGQLRRSPIRLEQHDGRLAGALKHKQAEHIAQQQLQHYGSSDCYLQSQATSQNLASTHNGGPVHSTSSNHMHQVAAACHSNQQQVHNIYLNQDLTNCSPSDPKLSQHAHQQQQYFAGQLQQQRLNQVVAQAQQASSALTQLRHRVGSLSVTRREPPGTPSAVCAARTSIGLSRSLSFSEQLGQRPSQLNHSIQQLQETLVAGDELCCRVSCQVAGQEADRSIDVNDNSAAQCPHQAAHYCDIYGNRRQLASGSLSSACSSIGSPPSMTQPISPQLMPNQSGHNPRPISSNSSCDGNENYIHYEQQQQQSALPRYDFHFSHLSQQQQQQLQPVQHGLGGADQSRTATCTSSIISTSDSLAMSINLEQYISKRNERERSRVRNVNDAFDNLKNSLPLDVDKMSKRMSKVEILRTAIGYIRNLEQILGYKHQQRYSTSGYKHADFHVKSRLSCNSRRLDSSHKAQLNSSHNLHHGHCQSKKFQAHHRYQRRMSDNENRDELGGQPDGDGHLFPGALSSGDVNISAVEEYERERPQQVDSYQQEQSANSQADSDQDRVDGNCSMEEDDRFEDY